MNSHVTTNTANNGTTTPVRAPTPGTNRGQVTPAEARNPASGGNPPELSQISEGSGGSATGAGINNNPTATLAMALPPPPETSLIEASKIKSKLSEKTKKAKRSKAAEENPKLSMIKDLVEAQPTKELQTMLFGFAENTLVSLQEIKQRGLGVAKLNSDDGYIPVSVRFNPSFNFPPELNKDLGTIANDTKFKDVVLKCQLDLADIIKKQGERNHAYRITALQEKVIKEMITLGGYFVDHQREECELFAATANNDALAKGAVINFIKCIGWLDEFQPFVLRKPLRFVFPQKEATTKEWIKNTVTKVQKICVGLIDAGNSEKWMKLVHKEDREQFRMKYLEEKKKEYETNPVIDNNNVNNTAEGEENGTNVNKDTGVGTIFTRSIIRNNIIPQLAQAPAKKHAIRPSTFREENYKFIWNGTSLYNRKSTINRPRNAYEAWLQMEMNAQKELLSENSMTFDTDQYKIDTENQKLSDQILYWYMELFPNLVGVPFSIATEEAKKNRAITKLKASIKAAKEQDLAKAIEEKVELDDEHIRIPRDEFNKTVHAESKKVIMSHLNKQKQKNSSREKATNSRTQGKGGESGNNKWRKTIRINETNDSPPSILKKTNKYTRQKNSKSNQTPQKTKGKHQPKLGGRKQHQHHRKRKADHVQGQKGGNRSKKR